MNADGCADERDVVRLETDTATLRASLEALSAEFRAEVRRIDQVATLREEGVGVALTSAEKAVVAALAAADKATNKAEAGTRQSFKEVNEFRRALEELQKLMATRREMEDYKTLTTQRLDELAKQIVTLGSRLDTAPEVRALMQRADLTQGRSGGAHDTRESFRATSVALISFVGLIVVLATFYFSRTTPASKPPTVIVNVPKTTTTP